MKIPKPLGPCAPHEPLSRVFGVSEEVQKSWTEHGRPADFRAFRMGYDSGYLAGKRDAKAPPDELLAELRHAGRLLFLAHKQLGMQQRAAYLRNASAEGLINTDDLRDSERAAVLAKFGGKS